jgi:hypothetical protein
MYLGGLKSDKWASFEKPGLIFTNWEIELPKSKILAAATTVALLISIGTPAQALPILINFDGLSTGVAVTNQFAGVTFSNTITANGNPVSSPNTIKAISSGFQPKVGSPLIATFSSAATSVSIVGSNVGGSGIRIDAYDAVTGGSIIGFDSFIGTGLGSGVTSLLSVSTSGIFRVEFYQPLTTGEGVEWDDFTYEPASASASASEPATLAIFGLGLAGLGLMRRRKRVAAQRR